MDSNEKPESNPSADFASVQRYLVDGVIAANAQIAVLKRLLIDHKVILDIDAFEEACLKQQEIEANKLAAKSEYAGRIAQRAKERLGINPQEN